MAKRRMFNQDITNNDIFLELPAAAQALYFQLSMNADDSGFVSPKRVLRMTGFSEYDLRVLLDKRYVLAFDSGVVVIKHWKVNNYLRPDRCIPTNYKKELAQLTTNEWGAYTECQPNDNQMTTKSQPSVAKSSVVESSIVNYSFVNSDKPNTRKKDLEKLFTELVTALGFTEQVKYTDGRLKKLALRLKTYGTEELLKAAKIIGEDDYMQGDNEGGKRYGNIDYLLRSDEIIDKWLSINADSNNEERAKEAMKKYV